MGLVIRVILQRKARYDKTVICECNSKDMYNKHIEEHDQTDKVKNWCQCWYHHCKNSTIARKFDIRDTIKARYKKFRITKGIENGDCDEETQACRRWSCRVDTRYCTLCAMWHVIARKNLRNSSLWILTHFKSERERGQSNHYYNNAILRHHTYHG